MNENNQNRLEILGKLIRERDLATQSELQEQLASEYGLTTTQASISRDLRKLGVLKAGGFYRLPEIRTSASGSHISFHRAGPHLLVLRTGPGEASRSAYVIDQSKTNGVVGTIAGDDTIFVALADQSEHIVHSIKNLFTQL